MNAMPEKRAAAPRRGMTVDTPGGVLAHLSRSSTLTSLTGRLVRQGLPPLLWSLGRTGRSGLLGLALLGSSGIFYLSTQHPLETEIVQLRTDLESAEARAARSPPAPSTDGPRSIEGLPLRTEIPKLLAVLLQQADAAQLAIDSAKYEIAATKTGALVRYQISFPVSGPYARIRGFIDSTLAAMPALAIEELSISRKTIADPGVEAQIRMVLFTRSAP